MIGQGHGPTPPFGLRKTGAVALDAELFQALLVGLVQPAQQLMKCMTPAALNTAVA